MSMKPRCYAWTCLKSYLCLLSAFLVSFSAKQALACASCGSGTGAPLVLAPNESSKFFLGLGADFDFWSHNARRESSVDRTLQTRWRSVWAAGLALSPRSFVTLTTSYVWNFAKHPADARGSGFGDPLLHYRYTAVQQDLTTPLVPQLQLVLGHRFVGGQSIRDACSKNCVVDATGSGTQETELGFDLWSGMSLVKWGFAHSILFPHERTFAGNVSYEAGRGYQSVATIGVARDDLGKVNVGITHLERENIRVSGETVPQSKSESFGYYITTEYWPAPLHTLRLSYAHTGVAVPWIPNRNASGQKSISLSFIRALSRE